MISSLEVLAFIKMGMNNIPIPITRSNTPIMSPYRDQLAEFSVEVDEQVDFQLNLDHLNLGFSNILPYGIGFYFVRDEFTVLLMGDANINPPFDIGLTNIVIYFPSNQMTPNFSKIWDLLLINTSLFDNPRTLKSFFVMGKVYRLQERGDFLQIRFISDEEEDMISPRMRAAIHGEGEDMF